MIRDLVISEGIPDNVREAEETEMMEFCSFAWPVFDGGYECLEVVDHESGKLDHVSVEPTDFSDSVRLKKPLLDNPSLFREFAELPLTEEGILSFANEWGQLLTRPDLDLEAEEESEDDDRVPACDSTTFDEPGDVTDHWYQQIKRMRALVRVWDLIQEGDEAGLAQVMKAQRLGGLQTVGVDFTEIPEPRRLTYINREDLPDHLRRLKAGRLQEFAKLALYEHVNGQFEDRCSPWIAPDPDTREPVLRLTPRNLEAALWFQFADAIAGKKKLRQCPRCKRYFAVSEQGKGRRSRSDRVWCSDACRIAGFLERRETALLLHQQGKSKAEIARQLGVKESSLKKWIESRDQSEGSAGGNP
jgi:hypothetical protein